MIELYDSLAPPPKAKHILDTLERWYLEDTLDKAQHNPAQVAQHNTLGKAPGAGAGAKVFTKRVVVQGVPKQLDGAACGVFTCAFAELLARGCQPPFEFCQVRTMLIAPDED